MAITINTFLLALLLLLILIAIQIVQWRLFKPQKQIASLFRLFLFLPLIFGVFTYFQTDFHEYFPAAILLLALSVVYIQSFPAIQAVSPSLEMIEAVKQKMPNGGATFEDIRNALLTDRLLEDRLDDLVLDGWIDKTNDELKLKASGLFLARIFYYYRKALGLPRGDG